VKVTGDGKGVASHAGSLLLAELADRVSHMADDVAQRESADYDSVGVCILARL
jgi:hypothetical protein